MRAARRTPVLLVLDTSFSMYQANAVAELKQAASRFVAGLEKSGFQLFVRRSPLALDAVFDDLARRIRKVYVYDYYSPNLSGRHTLDVKVSANGRSARTGVLSFDGTDKVVVAAAPLMCRFRAWPDG